LFLGSLQLSNYTAVDSAVILSVR